MINPSKKSDDKAQGANPWADEVYTEHGVEYRDLYPITPDDKKEADDEDED